MNTHMDMFSFFRIILDRYQNNTSTRVLVFDVTHRARIIATQSRKP